MDITSFLKTLLEICGGISILGGGATVIWSILKPTVNLRKRVDTLEENVNKDYKSIGELKAMQASMCQALIAIIDHEITGNNIDGLKKTKSELIKKLSEE